MTRATIDAIRAAATEADLTLAEGDIATAQSDIATLQSENTLISQVDAETGTATNVEGFSAERVKQAIEALAGGSAWSEAGSGLTLSGNGAQTLTGIGTNANEVIVTATGVGVAGSTWGLRMGDSGGVETSGYTTNYIYVGASAYSQSDFTNFVFYENAGAGGEFWVHFVRRTGHRWHYSAQLNGASYFRSSIGTKATSAPFDRVEIQGLNKSGTMRAFYR